MRVYVHGNSYWGLLRADHGRSLNLGVFELFFPFSDKRVIQNRLDKL